MAFRVVLFRAMSTSAGTIKQAKSKLRREIAAKLDQLSPDEVAQQSRLVHEKIFALDVFCSAQRVGIYLSLPNEIDTISILERCFELGKKCFVPRYTPKSVIMDFVELFSMQDYHTLPIEPKWRIKQPDPEDGTRAEALSTGGLDLLLVPGVAFTNEGLRLGHGMGYFDRWQRRCFDTTNIRHPVTVALAFRQQIVHDLPVTELDVPIDKVITP